MGYRNWFAPKRKQHEYFPSLPFALNGATPEKIITGIWTEEKNTQLREKIANALQLGIETNKAVRFPACLA